MSLFVYTTKWLGKKTQLLKELKGCILTCAFLQAAGPLSVHPQLAVKVLLPELGKPHVPPVVGERAAAEVSIERCWGGKKKIGKFG